MSRLLTAPKRLRRSITQCGKNENASECGTANSSMSCPATWWPRIMLRVACRLPRISRACEWKVSPAGVRRVGYDERSTRSVPAQASSAWMRREKAGWVTCRSCAEREKLRVSARLTKSSSHLVSTRGSVATAPRTRPQARPLQPQRGWCTRRTHRVRDKRKHRMPPSHPRRTSMTRRWLVLPLLWLGLFGGCVDPSRVAPEPACRIEPGAMGEVVARAGVADGQGAPEIASGYRRGMRAARARSFMVVTANPLASRTGCEVLSHGGTAADAAVAVQMVLGLVEPQSSGLGGGAFALYFDAAHGTVQAYDGRETAPIASTADDLRWISDQQRRAPQPDARGSGRSIGTPGVVRMLELLHVDHGRLAWKPLLQPSIDLAREGFSVSPRLAASIAGSRAQLQRDAQASTYFL